MSVSVCTCVFVGVCVCVQVCVYTYKSFVGAPCFCLSSFVHPQRECLDKTRKEDRNRISEKKPCLVSAKTHIHKSKTKGRVKES